MTDLNASLILVLNYGNGKRVKTYTLTAFLSQ